MSAQAALIKRTIRFQDTPISTRDVYAVTGLTENSANSVPLPASLPRVPFRASVSPVGNGALGVMVSMDTSQGTPDPTGSFSGGKLGVDSGYAYLYIGAGTQCLLIVEW